MYRAGREVEGESSQSARCTYEKLLKQMGERERMRERPTCTINVDRRETCTLTVKM